MFEVKYYRTKSKSIPFKIRFGIIVIISIKIKIDKLVNFRTDIFLLWQLKITINQTSTRPHVSLSY